MTQSNYLVTRLSNYRTRRHDVQLTSSRQGYGDQEP